MKRLAVGLCALSLSVAACSSDEPQTPAADDSPAAEPIELTVFAASSLTDVFTEEIGPAFEGANEGTTVVFNFGASDALAGQIQSEGTADVFASASGTWMDAVAEGSGRHRPRPTSCTNRLVIITPPDNPAGIAVDRRPGRRRGAARARRRGRAGRRLRARGARATPASPTRPRPTSSRTRRTTPASSPRSRPATATQASSTSPTSRRQPATTSPPSRSPTT